VALGVAPTTQRKKNKNKSDTINSTIYGADLSTGSFSLFLQPLTPSPSLRYDCDMSATAEKLAREISSLPPEEMLALHARLLRALYATQDNEQLDPAFRAEIVRRINDIDAGKIDGADAFDALKRM